MRADKDVYAYFQSRGFEIVDDVEAYDGVHGVFAHKDNDGKTYVKVGYHEGLVDSKTWLAVQDKKAHNRKFPNNGKAKRSFPLRQAVMYPTDRIKKAATGQGNAKIFGSDDFFENRT